MSIEVRIPKEIKEYKEKIIFGLNLRQLISVLVGGIICLSTFFLIKPIVGVDLASDIIIIEAVPIFAFGFIKVRSFNFETYAKIFIKHKLGKNKRTYENKLYMINLKEEVKNRDYSKKEVRKVESVKVSSENEKTRTVGRNEKNKIIRERIKRAKKEFKAETKRAETEELDKSKEQLEIAKKQYQKARKAKVTKNKKK
jgi:hypothetical protein